MKATDLETRPRSTRMLLLRLAAVGASVVLAGLSGCGGEKTTGPGPQPQPQPPMYLKPIFPGYVLQNLALAYKHRDPAAYDTLFAEDYTGRTIDQSNPDSVKQYDFAKADEIRHIWALSRSTTITDIQLELMPTMIRYTDAGDPPGWAVIQNPIYSLSIADGPSTFSIARDRETMEFHFKPKTPDSSSPTDTTWTIVRWTEVAL